MLQLTRAQHLTGLLAPEGTPTVDTSMLRTLCGCFHVHCHLLLLSVILVSMTIFSLLSDNTMNYFFRTLSLTITLFHLPGIVTQVPKCTRELGTEINIDDCNELLLEYGCKRLVY